MKLNSLFNLKSKTWSGYCNSVPGIWIRNNSRRNCCSEITSSEVIFISAQKFSVQNHFEKLRM